MLLTEKKRIRISRHVEFFITRCNIPYGKNKGVAHFTAHGLHVDNGVGCPWAAHGNFAMQIRLPLLPYMETVGSSVGSLVGSPLLPNMKKWAAEWAAHGLPMGILPCKLGCPLLPYMETVGSSVGSSLLPYMETVGSSVGSGVCCSWEFCHAN